ncbi:hypothetical protein HY224_01085, partial [Candidatus Uhrbacteria bacterium]|nr:hypothetical protein [Candidatus Uhrbacteria bacterium]
MSKKPPPPGLQEGLQQIKEKASNGKEKRHRETLIELGNKLLHDRIKNLDYAKELREDIARAASAAGLEDGEKSSLTDLIVILDGAITHKTAVDKALENPLVKKALELRNNKSRSQPQEIELLEARRNILESADKLDEETAVHGFFNPGRFRKGDQDDRAKAVATELEAIKRQIQALGGSKKKEAEPDEKKDAKDNKPQKPDEKKDKAAKPDPRLEKVNKEIELLENASTPDDEIEEIIPGFKDTKAKEPEAAQHLKLLRIVSLLEEKDKQKKLKGGEKQKFDHLKTEKDRLGALLRDQNEQRIKTKKKLTEDTTREEEAGKKIDDAVAGKKSTSFDEAFEEEDKK